MDAASNLSATLRGIPLYGLLAFFRLVPSRKSIATVNLALVGLSRDVNSETVIECLAIIFKEIKI